MHVAFYVFYCIVFLLIVWLLITVVVVLLLNVLTWAFFTRRLSIFLFFVYFLLLLQFIVLCVLAGRWYMLFGSDVGVVLVEKAYERMLDVEEVKELVESPKVVLSRYEPSTLYLVTTFASIIIFCLLCLSFPGPVPVPESPFPFYWPEAGKWFRSQQELDFYISCVAKCHRIIDAHIAYPFLADMSDGSSIHTVYIGTPPESVCSSQDVPSVASLDLPWFLLDCVWKATHFPELKDCWLPLIVEGPAQLSLGWDFYFSNSPLLTLPEFSSLKLSGRDVISFTFDVPSGARSYYGPFQPTGTVDLIPFMASPMGRLFAWNFSSLSEYILMCSMMDTGKDSGGFFLDTSSPLFHEFAYITSPDVAMIKAGIWAGIREGSLVNIFAGSTVSEEVMSFLSSVEQLALSTVVPGMHPVHAAFSDFNPINSLKTLLLHYNGACVLGDSLSLESFLYAPYSDTDVLATAFRSKVDSFILSSGVASEAETFFLGRSSAVDLEDFSQAYPVSPYAMIPSNQDADFVPYVLGRKV